MKTTEPVTAELADLIAERWAYLDGEVGKVYVRVGRLNLEVEADDHYFEVQVSEAETIKVALELLPLYEFLQKTRSQDQLNRWLHLTGSSKRTVKELQRRDLLAVVDSRSAQAALAGFENLRPVARFDIRKNPDPAFLAYLTPTALGSGDISLTPDLYHVLQDTDPTWDIIAATWYVNRVYPYPGGAWANFKREHPGRSIQQYTDQINDHLAPGEKPYTIYTALLTFATTSSVERRVLLGIPWLLGHDSGYLTWV